MAWVKRDKEGRVLDGEASRIQYFSLVIAKATAELKSGDSLVQMKAKVVIEGGNQTVMSVMQRNRDSLWEVTIVIADIHCLVSHLEELWLVWIQRGTKLMTGIFGVFYLRQAWWRQEQGWHGAGTGQVESYPYPYPFFKMVPIPISF